MYPGVPATLFHKFRIDDTSSLATVTFLEYSNVDMPCRVYNDLIITILYLAPRHIHGVQDWKRFLEDWRKRKYGARQEDQRQFDALRPSGWDMCGVSHEREELDGQEERVFDR